jgi:fatty-acyl-CoA synthase
VALAADEREVPIDYRSVEPMPYEELMAWIRIREGAEPPTAESLRAFCAGRIAHHKIPRYVQVTEEFPMTVTGKVQKYKMREAAIELLGLQDAARTETA